MIFSFIALISLHDAVNWLGNQKGVASYPQTFYFDGAQPGLTLQMKTSETRHRVSTSTC